MRCPYCLAPLYLNKTQVEKRGGRLTVYVCSECKREIPPDYIQDKNVQKISIGLVGFRAHGKTTYLSILFYLLKKFPNYWHNGFSLRVLNEKGIELIYKKMKLLKNGQLPEATPTNFPEPVLIKFSEIPVLKTYFVSFYDTSGEVFENPAAITDAGAFVAYSDVVLFVLSIYDAYQKEEEDWVDEIKRLLDIYIMAIKTMGINTKKNQHLIVILTKADLLMGSNAVELPNELKDYLNEGTYRSYVPFDKARIDRIKEKSRQIREWLDRKGAFSFIAEAEKNFKSVEYTMVSALGAKPMGDRLGVRLSPEIPKRILDPFLLALDKTKKNSWFKF